MRALDQETVEAGRILLVVEQAMPLHAAPHGHVDARRGVRRQQPQASPDRDAFDRLGQLDHRQRARQTGCIDDLRDVRCLGRGFVAGHVDVDRGPVPVCAGAPRSTS